MVGEISKNYGFSASLGFGMAVCTVNLVWISVYLSEPSVQVPLLSGRAGGMLRVDWLILLRACSLYWIKTQHWEYDRGIYLVLELNVYRITRLIPSPYLLILSAVSIYYGTPASSHSFFIIASIHVILSPPISSDPLSSDTKETKNYLIEDQSECTGDLRPTPPPLSFHPLETLKKVRRLFGDDCLGELLMHSLTIWMTDYLSLRSRLLVYCWSPPRKRQSTHYLYRTEQYGTGSVWICNKRGALRWSHCQSSRLTD